MGAPGAARVFNTLWRDLWLGTLLAVLFLSGCSRAADDLEEFEPEVDLAEGPSVWQLLGKRLESEGDVTTQLALDAFATVIGPIPDGIPVTTDATAVSSGSGALRWLHRFWDDLSDDQRDAADRAVGVRHLNDALSRAAPTVAPPAIDSQVIRALWREAAGAGQALDGPSLHDGLSQLVDTIAHDFASKHQVSFPPRVVVAAPFPDPPPPSSKRLWAAATSMTPADPADPSGEWQTQTTGPIDTCVILFFPNAVELFEHVTAAGDQAQEHPRRYLHMLVAHELYHCHQRGVSGDLARHIAAPPWIVEGSAEWAGRAYAYADGGRLEHPHWSDYLDNPGRDLFARSYDALGFFAHLASEARAPAEPWELVDWMVRQPWDRDDRERLSGAAFRQAAGVSALFLPRWAMGVVRDPQMGNAWNASGPGLVDYLPPPPPYLRVGADHELSADPRAISYETIDLEPAVMMLRVEARGFGALHWHADAHDDLFSDLESLTFCVDPGGCRCPEGSEFVGDEASFLDRSGPVITVALTGGLEPGEVRLQPSFAEDMCVMEFALCDTVLDHATLTDVVTGGTHATGPTGIDPVVTDHDGLVVSCTWSVVQSAAPAHDDPFFNWAISVHVVLHYRGDETDEEWHQGLDVVEQTLVPCEPVRIPGHRAQACMRTRQGSVDLLARAGAGVWVSLGSSRSDGAPDVDANRLSVYAVVLAGHVLASLTP